MALSVGLTQAGTPPESLATEAHVTVAQVEGGFGITKIELSVTGKVPGLDADGFAARRRRARRRAARSRRRSPPSRRSRSRRRFERPVS